MVLILELASAVALIVGIGLLSIPVGVICAGLIGLAFAFAIERGKGK